MDQDEGILSAEQEQEFQAFDALKQKSTAYKVASTDPAIHAILEDLEKFCRGNETCVSFDNNNRVDERMTFVLLGRREVLQRIQNHINLNARQLFELYTGRRFNPNRRTEDGN